MVHLNTNNLLYSKQHGFHFSQSCETQLFEFTGNILQYSDRKQCNAIAMDFSKAFDKVSHDQLLFKFDRAGSNSQTCAWVKSFLSRKTLKVVIDGEESIAVRVTSGVPQGSVSIY